MAPPTTVVGHTGAVDDFVIARNPEDDSSLPFLVRLPLGTEGVVLKVRETWPRTAKLYAHTAPWPDEADVVERVPVRSCARRGAAIDLVLDRGRESRSQFVFTMARGREMIFWQSARTSRQARPNVTVPRQRAAGRVLEILVDSHEQRPWTFRNQQATTVRRALPAGDYAVVDGDRVVAAVERKTLTDLVSTLTSGKLRSVLAGLAGVPRSAVVVEDRWSAVFKLTFVRPAVVAEGLAEAQVRFPEVPIVFCETRPLAQEWAYRFLGAALDHHLDDAPAQLRLDELTTAGPLAAPGPRLAARRVVASGPPTPEIRAWAVAAGFDVADRGRLPTEVRAAYDASHPG